MTWRGQMVVAALLALIAGGIAVWGMQEHRKAKDADARIVQSTTALATATTYAESLKLAYEHQDQADKAAIAALQKKATTRHRVKIRFADGQTYETDDETIDAETMFNSLQSHDLSTQLPPPPELPTQAPALPDTGRPWMVGGAVSTDWTTLGGGVTLGARIDPFGIPVWGLITPGWPWSSAAVTVQF